MKSAETKKKTDRKSRILELLTENESLTPMELTHILNVSLSTARRDLDEMAEAGLIKRKFGSAETLSLPGEEMPFALRSTVNQNEKTRIARAALDLVENGDTIFIAGGSTTLEFAKLLPGQKRITVITHSLRVANILVDKPGIDLILMGGSLLPDEQIMVSPLAETATPQYRANKLFYGTQAVNLKHGLTHSRVTEVNMERTIARMVDHIILLVDHSKFGKTAPVFVMPISSIHTVVTGRELDEQIVFELEETNIKVVLA